MRPKLELVAAPAREPDAAALERVASGDVGALGEVYDRHAPALFAFVRQLVPPSDVEDVVQTVFVRLVSLAPAFRPGAPSAKPWLFGIAVRVVCERRRSFRRLTAFVAKLSRVTPAQVTVPLAERSDLDRALAELSPPKREAIWLAEVEGMSAADIAEIQGVPVGTVWTRLHHARRELRERLGGSP